MKKLIIIFLPTAFILMLMYEKLVPNPKLSSTLSSENLAAINGRTIKPNASGSANDENNLGGNWHFSYSCTQSSEETWKSINEEHIKKSSGRGTGYMIVDAPPEQDGDVIINTEQGDSVISSTVNGTYNYYESDVTGTDNQIDEKRVDNYSGKSKKGQGLLFEYNSKDKGDQGGIQEAGISFDITGTDTIWNHGGDGKLRKFIDQINEKNWAGIGLGHKEDKVTKIKNGYAIDYNQTKDSSNTYGGGVKHTFKSTEQYHAELMRIPKN
ncbi:MAG: hypothetical protein ABI237_08325 [Ginsengibacter sp.]